jgi:hypothetical protein
LKKVWSYAIFRMPKWLQDSCNKNKWFCCYYRVSKDVKILTIPWYKYSVRGGSKPIFNFLLGIIFRLLPPIEIIMFDQLMYWLLVVHN